MDPLLFDFTLVSRVVVGTLLGFAVGWEREHRGSFAGDRTFALVALGSSAFTAVGVENFPSTAEKVMAGVVSGIGFLGAGMIMKGDGGVVKGLTTAASMWAVAAVGMLAGVGELLMAAAVAALMVFILELDNIPGLRTLGHGKKHTATRSNGSET